MRGHAAALAASLLLAFAAPAAAEDARPDLRARARSLPPTWTVDTGAQLRWWVDRGAAALAPEAMTSSHIAIGRALTRHGGMDLAVFVRLASGDARGELFQTLDTHLSQTALTGGVRLEMPLARRLRVIVHGETGAARTSVAIGDELGSMAPVDDAEWGPLGIATLGLELAAVEHPRFHLAIRVEAGFAFVEAVAVDAYPRSRPAEDLSIETVYTSLGALDTSGRTLGLGLRAGF